MRFIDLFAGLGGFHEAMSSLGHECVFACESEPELRELYRANYPNVTTVHGDIRECKSAVPDHEILCAGFPCQPFSKSGFQSGLKDTTRGTLFHEIVSILEKRRPPYIILENVGNFELHDGGRTWRIVRDSLIELGYQVKATEHIRSRGHGLVSPHHLGYPHTRERFFVVGCNGNLPDDPFPPREHRRRTTFDGIVQDEQELGDDDRAEVALTIDQVACIDHWNELIQSIPDEHRLPSFPIWGDEIDARYPYTDKTPYSCTKDELLAALRVNGHCRKFSKDELLALLPSYARSRVEMFPQWKQAFLRKNREWFDEVRMFFPTGWVDRLREFVPSNRKFEWNCQGEPRDLWRCVLQFRPSGLRAKRYSASPALVAMTTTQIPVLGPERRFLTRREGLRLQGFPDAHLLPKTRAHTFRALGNAVHIGVARAVAQRLLGVNHASHGGQEGGIGERNERWR